MYNQHMSDHIGIQVKLIFGECAHITNILAVVSVNQPHIDLPTLYHKASTYTFHPSVGKLSSKLFLWTMKPQTPYTSWYSKFFQPFVCHACCWRASLVEDLFWNLWTILLYEYHLNLLWKQRHQDDLEDNKKYLIRMILHTRRGRPRGRRWVRCSCLPGHKQSRLYGHC